MAKAHSPQEWAREAAGDSCTRRERGPQVGKLPTPGARSDAQLLRVESQAQFYQNARPVVECEAAPNSDDAPLSRTHSPKTARLGGRVQNAVS
jgi:hypothetical protein